MRGYLDRGYKVVKMKIGGASLEEDLRRIEAVLSELGSGGELAVDANGRFDLKTALAYQKETANEHESDGSIRVHSWLENSSPNCAKLNLRSSKNTAQHSRN
jgi:hypothetical protein